VTRRRPGTSPTCRARFLGVPSSPLRKPLIGKVGWRPARNVRTFDTPLLPVPALRPEAATGPTRPKRRR
jgi:hypothetical protein